jgi:choline dehydrogenase
VTAVDRDDVVVVGGGSAGCVVAARLAETASRSVLLLEAGPDLRARVPDDLRDGWNLSREFDWGFESEPDERGVVEHVRRGKLLGGTSLVTRFAVRGSPADFGEWEALGNDGWSFDDVLPYFKRLESDVEFGDRPWHGDGGPIPITRYPELELTEIASVARDELVALGFPEVEDHNRPGAVGVGRMPMSSRGGVRVTTADAYLPAGGTPANLTIRADTHVAEVVFEGARATGVRTLDGAVIEAGWVVLCAGTYGSPAILMRSGVGPADHLGSVGVPVRVDLPGVGSNLTDHPAVDVDPGYRGQGRSAPVLHTIATFHSSAAATDGPPDLMLWVADPSGEYSIDVVLLKPDTRGRVRLRSIDRGEPPLIELPRVREGTDVDRLAEGFRRGWELAARPELRRLCDEAAAPEAGVADELRRAIRQEAYSIPHTVGTCSMGPSPDDGAVVDASSGVHGTERLSVVDASIIPIAPSGFPHVVTIMLAERLSEEIAARL